MNTKIVFSDDEFKALIERVESRYPDVHLQYGRFRGKDKGWIIHFVWKPTKEINSLFYSVPESSFEGTVYENISHWVEDLSREKIALEAAKAQQKAKEQAKLEQDRLSRLRRNEFLNTLLPEVKRLNTYISSNSPLRFTGNTDFENTAAFFGDTVELTLKFQAATPEEAIREIEVLREIVFLRIPSATGQALESEESDVKL